MFWDQAMGDKKYQDQLHPSHKTRYSDSSYYDEVCVYCGETDRVPGGWGNLKYPCAKEPEERRVARLLEASQGFKDSVESK